MILTNTRERSDMKPGRFRGTPGNAGAPGGPPRQLICTNQEINNTSSCSDKETLVPRQLICCKQVAHAMPALFVGVSMPSCHQKTCLPVNQNLILDVLCYGTQSTDQAVQEEADQQQRHRSDLLRVQLYLSPPNALSQVKHSDPNELIKNLQGFRPRLLGSGSTAHGP